MPTATTDPHPPMLGDLRRDAQLAGLMTDRLALTDPVIRVDHGLAGAEAAGQCSRTRSGSATIGR